MKNDVVNNIRLDINRQKNNAVVHVRAGDTKARTIHFTITDKGTVMNLDDVVIAVITITKPDGKHCYNDLVRQDNELHYTVTSQTVNVPGECACEIELTFKDGTRIGIPGFTIMVYEKYLSDSYIESLNEYKAVNVQIALTKECAENTKKAVAECEGYKNASETACKTTEKTKGEVEDIYKEVEELEKMCRTLTEQCKYLYQQFAETGVAQVVYQNAVAYTDQAIANLINGAPTTLDTLNEIAEAMTEHAEVVDALEAAIGSKADATETTSLINQLDERVDTLEDSRGYPIS